MHGQERAAGYIRLPFLLLLFDRDSDDPEKMAENLLRRVAQMAVEPNKIIYSMMRVSKFYDKKPVIKDISLSYFYGAKIGVLGLNGSGKSSLLRIMAGVEREFNGQAVLSQGYSVGFLEQEPRLDDTKSVRQVVEEGVQETVDLLNEFNEITAKFAEPM